MSFLSPALRTETRALWHLAWPMLIGQLATVGMVVADVSMTGHVSANDLAAIALGASVWSIIIVTVMGVMMSVNASVAHLVGAGEHARIPPLVRQALWAGLLVGLAGLAASNLATLIFDSMDMAPVVRDMAKSFLHIVSFALPPLACYRALYGYSASLNHTKPMMVFSLAALVLNIVLNWLLIYGHFGLPRLGGLGCAVSSLACVWLNFLGMLWWVSRAPHYRDTNPLIRLDAPHWPEIRNLLKIGLPIGVTYFAESSAFGLIALLVARFGAEQVAAHQIALNFSSLVFMVPMSLGVALITRVGQALGEGDPAAARYRAWVGVGLSLGFAVLSATFIALFNHQIAAFYTSDPVVLALAAHLLVFAALFQLSDATQVATSCAIRGYKVTRPPMVIHMIAFWSFSLPLGCVLGLGWVPGIPAMAAEGFWIALVVGLTVAAIGLSLFLQRLSRQRLMA